MTKNLDGKLAHLQKLVSQLRSPHGCPWDIEQTHQSLIPYLIEEAYELVEVLNENPKQDWKIKDELGDCLYQVVIHAQIASEEGRFDLGDVVQSISDKITRRHPHVFGGLGPWTKEQVLTEWDNIKRKEKQNQPVDLHPKIKDPYFEKELYWSGLEEAREIGIKAKEYRFDWDSWKDVMNKVQEELHEVQQVCETESMNPQRLEEEIGDLLFAAAQFARSLNVDPEKALQSANNKFRKRFSAMIQNLYSQNGTSPSKNLAEFKALSSAEKEQLWQQAK